MEIVSGKTGSPHVTSQQFRQILEGTIGQGSCILTSGENLEPELTSNNLLKIRSGIMAHHGNVSAVKIGTYDEVTITNGTQGMKRKDLVVNRYTRNKETGIETNEWLYIMGTPTSGTPTVPAYTKGNLQEGDLVDDCPVFEITLDGINVTEVKKLLEVLPSMATINKDLADTSDKIAVKSYKQADMHLQSFYNVSAFSAYKVGREVHFNVSLDPKSGTTLLANKLYAITSAAIATDLRPAVLTHIQCVGCGQGWENTCAVMAYVDTNGIIYFSTPATRAFYKFHGIWIAAN
ncbi:hypothetical protein [[Ruminococcus] lactaris]|uniref:hypothetical protein n=1 Tax=[Ruminococcus] lactaris TaxID=46228 RepID=UPI0035217F4D